MIDLPTMLREAVALVERATPGDVRMRIRTRDDSIYVAIGDSKRGPHAQGDVHLPEDDVFAMVTAVNLLKQHGPALVGVVAERDALLKLAERWERIADEKGVTTFTGNDHRLFANELRAAMTPPAGRD